MTELKGTVHDLLKNPRCALFTSVSRSSTLVRARGLGECQRHVKVSTTQLEGRPDVASVRWTLVCRSRVLRVHTRSLHSHGHTEALGRLVNPGSHHLQ